MSYSLWINDEYVDEVGSTSSWGNFRDWYGMGSYPALENLANTLVLYNDEAGDYSRVVRDLRKAIKDRDLKTGNRKIAQHLLGLLEQNADSFSFIITDLCNEPLPHYDFEQDDGEVPTSRELVRALKGLSITDKQRALLAVHYHAPRQTATMGELAEAAGYRDWRGAKVQYGRLARDLGHALEHDRGERPWLNLLVRFHHQRGVAREHWRLKMIPELAKALESLGWTVLEPVSGRSC